MLIQLVLLLTALGPGALSAQHANVGGLLQRYVMTEPEDVRVRSIELITSPFSVQAPLMSGMSLSMSGAYAVAAVHLDNAAEEQTGGWIDTRLSLQAGGDRVLLTLSAILPTGEVVQDLGDVAVVGLLSTDLMPFAVSQWSTGGGFMGDASYALFGSNSALTLTVGGARFTESHPLESPSSFRPGWQLRGRAALEAAVGPAGVLSLLLGYREFGTDSYGSLDLFEPGGRIEGGMSYAFPVGRGTSAIVFGTASHALRSRSTAEASRVSDLAPVFSGLGPRASRTLALLGGEMRLDRGSYDLMPRAEVRVLRRGDGVGQGWLAMVGTRGGLDLGGTGGRVVRVEPAAALRLGRLVAANDIASGIIGWQAGIDLRWERRR